MSCIQPLLNNAKLPFTTDQSRAVKAAAWIGVAAVASGAALVTLAALAAIGGDLLPIGAGLVGTGAVLVFIATKRSMTLEIAKNEREARSALQELTQKKAAFETAKDALLAEIKYENGKVINPEDDSENAIVQDYAMEFSTLLARKAQTNISTFISRFFTNQKINHQSILPNDHKVRPNVQTAFDRIYSAMEEMYNAMTSCENALAKLSEQARGNINQIIYNEVKETYFTEQFRQI